ncbi:MAG: alpha/beta fold hydrolase, partial [Deltaproteobacteria bacterium]|nr:alpha/beta fold hydrolase [Deltaproteobacteria bacterium]
MRIGFLHGFAGDPDALAEVVSVLCAELDRRGHTLEPVIPRLPGHDVPIADGWDANLAEVSAALAGAEIVVGYSLGARVALGLLATDRIARAVLVSLNPGLASASEREVRAAGDRAWAAMLRDRGIAAFVDAWQAQPLFASQARVDPERLAARRARRLALPAEGLARSLETMGLAAMPDYRAALHARADRAHLIVGEEDAKFVAIARA